MSVCVAQADKFTAVGHATAKGVDAATSKVEVQLSPVVLQSSDAVNVKLKLTAPPQAKLGKAGIEAIFEVGLQPSVTVNPAAQVLYADKICASVAQADKFTALGQVTAKSACAGTTKVEVQLSPAVLQSSDAVNVKLKLTASPQAKLGKVGIEPIFEVALQPSFTSNPAAHVAYAVFISVSVAQADNNTSDGQATAKGVNANTVKVELQLTSPVVQSSVAFNVNVKLTPSPHT